MCAKEQICATVCHTRVFRLTPNFAHPYADQTIMGGLVSYHLLINLLPASPLGAARSLHNLLVPLPLVEQPGLSDGKDVITGTPID